MSPLYHSGQRLDPRAGQSLFECADELGVRLPTSCRRTGDCHECVVEVRRGLEALSPPAEHEAFLRGNYRLACQARIEDPSADIEFAVLRREAQILTEGTRADFAPDPLTVRRGADVCYLGGKGGAEAPERLDDYPGAIYGLAVDVGTTTVVANLVDLETAHTVFTASFENPQRFGGSDVMHRISYDGEYQGELRTAILSTLNLEIGEMCRAVSARRRHIFEMVVVGNSTMRDIFFGLDVQSIGRKPYKSLTEYKLERGERDTTSLDMKAGPLGIRIHPDARVYGAPLIGSHVGADVAAGLLTVGMDDEEDDVIFMDVGTNSEVIVGNRRRTLAASFPAGPAFEGAGISYAMQGYQGAVERVRLDDGNVAYSTIGGAEPQGICGSGLIDLLAELRRTERMNEMGAFAGGATEFTFVPEKGMTLSRSDVSALAQAKSANHSGQTIMLREYGVPLEQFARLYLAGGFANYIDVTNAVAIGFIAGLPESKIVKAGNAALEGATMMLLSAAKRRSIERFVRQIEHIELETSPDFFDLFVDGCQFKPMDI